MHTCVLLLGKHTSARALGMEWLSALCPRITQPSTAMTDKPNTLSPNTLTTHAPAPEEELLSLDAWAVSSLDALPADTSCTGTLALL